MPPAAAAGIGAVGGLAGGIMGGIQKMNAADQAQGNLSDAVGRYYNFNDPNYDDMKLKLQMLKQQGVLTPEMEQNILQNPSAYNDIMKEDPMLRQTDLDALGKLSNISNTGGMDAQAQLGYQQALNQSNAAAKGARDANLQGAAARGASGSGLEFVSNQLADQAGANSSQMAGLQGAAAANQRDLQALQGLTNLSGQMNTQDFNRQNAIAKARDDIGRFNTQTQQDVQQRNVYAKNSAQQANLASAQQIANQNAGLANYQQEYNAKIPQLQFQNNLDRARGASGLAPAQASASLAQGQAGADLYGGLGKGIAGAGASIYANQPKAQSDQLVKQQYQDANGKWVDY